jgi:hypothetical protein
MAKLPSVYGSVSRLLFNAHSITEGGEGGKLPENRGIHAAMSFGEHPKAWHEWQKTSGHAAGPIHFPKRWGGRCNVELGPVKE